jgi:D-3-phosphoglycerate dehydrogenase
MVFSDLWRMKRKILFLDKPHPFLPSRLSELGFEVEEDLVSPKSDILQRIGEYEGLVLRSRFSVDQAFIAAANRLRFIAREGVGLEHIDVEFAENQGISVLYSPEGSRDTVGEHALGMLLCLMNNLSRADRQVKQGQWVREANRAVELMGKTVGILGYGNMGSSFARKLQGFEAEVLAYDKFKTGYGDAFAREATLAEIFESADVLSIHIPYSVENHYFVNEAFLRQFRKPVFLVNTARGLVLNTADLVAHLKSGLVRGAALDVLEYEEVSFDKFRLEQLPDDFTYLQQADNVLLTPHVAGWSFESKEKHARVLAGKIGRLYDF